MIDWTIILSIVAGLGGLSGMAALVTAVYTARNTARKDEMDSLRLTIIALQQENQRQSTRIGELAACTNDLEQEGREKDKVIQDQARRIDDMQEEIKDLRTEVENYRSGRKKKATGPLSEGGPS